MFVNLLARDPAIFAVEKLPRAALISENGAATTMSLKRQKFPYRRRSSTTGKTTSWTILAGKSLSEAGKVRTLKGERVYCDFSTGSFFYGTACLGGLKRGFCLTSTSLWEDL